MFSFVFKWKKKFLFEIKFDFFNCSNKFNTPGSFFDFVGLNPISALTVLNSVCKIEPKIKNKGTPSSILSLLK